MVNDLMSLMQKTRLFFGVWVRIESFYISPHLNLSLTTRLFDKKINKENLKMV
jgi:hypothetical protein